MALFLGLFLIPFVLIGLMLIYVTIKKLRAPRAPAFVFAFSGLALTNNELEVALSWIRLDTAVKSPDATNIQLYLERDADTVPSLIRKKGTPSRDEIAEARSVDAAYGETTLRLSSAPRIPKKSFWDNQIAYRHISATLTWELQPRREIQAASWTLIAPESNG